MYSDHREPPRSRRRVSRRVDSAERTPPPRPVAPATWTFPDPEDADEDGVVGVGADLAPATLVAAYRRGIFPWPHDGIPLPWFSPDPRGVIDPEHIHISRSLRRTIRRCGWTTTVNVAFDAVVRGCADNRGAAGTWITPQLQRAYRRLHALGWAHSLEVWDGGSLIAGVYGVQLGGVFTGESMFHRRPDASKVALVDLADRFAGADGVLLDVQLTTDHLETMGAQAVPRAVFLGVLADSRDRDVRMVTSRLPVGRIE